MKSKKLLNLILIIICFSSVYAQKVTEETKDAAYSAPASALVGTWYGPRTWIINSNGTCEQRAFVYDGAMYGVDFEIVGKYTWKKRGNILTLKKIPGSIKCEVHTDDKQNYSQLSPRQKAEIQEERIRLLTKKAQNDFRMGGGEYYINYIDKDYMVLDNLNFENKKHYDRVQKEKEEAQKAREEASSPKKEAEFPGGKTAMEQWISENMKYPLSAKASRTQGKVLIKLIINNDGKITNPEILKSVSNDIDNEALRLVKNMPVWIPAQKNNENIPDTITVPINFQLN